jgi:flagellar biogenesis protein FliO
MRRLIVHLAAMAGGATAALALRATVAAQEAGAPSAPGGVAAFGFGDWIALGARLALVVLVIWAAVVAMRWYVRRMNGDAGGSAARRVEVLETRTLGPNRALVLVRLGRRAVLIGATQERITSLMEIDDPEEVDLLSRQPAAGETRSMRSLVGGITGALMATRASEPRAARPRGGGLTALLRRLSGRSARRAPARRQPLAAASLDAAPDLTPNAARAAVARSGYRQSQVAELQRAIADAQRGSARRTRAR